MDIGSGSGFPSATLSNFAPHPFVIDGVECNSMEGFLQSLKMNHPISEENIKAMRENMSPEDMKDFDHFIDTAWG